MIEAPGLHRKARIVARIWGLLGVAVWVLSAPFSSSAATLGPRGGTRDLVQHWDSVETYLNQYGYLTPSPDGAGNLRSEEKLRDAIRRMQRFGGVPVTGIVDSKTLSLLSRKRCGMPDLSPGERVRRYAVQGQKWEYKNLTWSIKYWPHSMSKHLARAELTRAFKAWSDVSQLSFREVNSLSADIVVSFERGKHGDGYAFDGRGVVLAHAFFPGDGIGGDAHFDAEEPWVDRETPGIDGVRLFAVAAHEFGHSLGLSHSSVDGALMNPFYKSIQDNFQLPDDDQRGIQMLYGSRNPTKWVPLRPYIPPATRSPNVPPRRPSSPDGRPTRPVKPRPPSPATTEAPTHPMTCNTSFDAVAVIRREIYFFKERYFWRVNSEGLMKNYPAEIKTFFYDEDLLVVDAVYEKPDGSTIVFFSGAQYWFFNGHTKEPGYPRPLTDLGLPPDLERIDAAMVWGYNGKTYLFAGEKYWRYDESEARVELDYPRDMSMWRGVPYNIDAAFQSTNGHTYFFKGRKFWTFNDNRMRVENKTNSNEFWFNCPSRTEHVPELDDEDEHKRDRFITNNSRLMCVASECVTLVSFVVTFLFYRTRIILYL